MELNDLVVEFEQVQMDKNKRNQTKITIRGDI